MSIEVEVIRQVLQQIATFALWFWFSGVLLFRWAAFRLVFCFCFLSATFGLWFGFLDGLGFASTVLTMQDSVEQASALAWWAKCDTDDQRSNECGPFHGPVSPVREILSPVIPRPLVSTLPRSESDSSAGSHPGSGRQFDSSGGQDRLVELEQCEVGWVRLGLLSWVMETKVTSAGPRVASKAWWLYGEKRL